MERVQRRLALYLVARGVAPESLTFAALVVSIAAGVALAAGGVAREPRCWLLVPSLGAVRLMLHALEARLVDCRASNRRREEPDRGHW